jgi:hypothetical protein
MAARTAAIEAGNEQLAIDLGADATKANDRYFATLTEAERVEIFETVREEPES